MKMKNRAVLAILLTFGLLAGTAAPAQARHHHRYYGRSSYIAPIVAAGIASAATSRYYDRGYYGYSPYGYSPYYGGGYYGGYQPYGYYGGGYPYGYGYGYRRHHSALPYIIGAAALGYALSR
jgi:hypothetical protein